MAGSLYITGQSVEERSVHTMEWEAECKDVTFARLISEGSFEATLTTEDEEHRIQLRSEKSIAQFLDVHSQGFIYLDITGLAHRVGAPLLKSIRTRSEQSFCVYVEPGDYRFSQAPTEVTIFDLSERIGGIEPLPGFVSLAAPAEGRPLFVPLLGFEGPRFAFMLEAVQPNREDIFPVIGVPGFRPEYPFYTYAGNRIQLWDTRSWANVRFATANCPFSLYHILEDLSKVDPKRRMVIAPIGTKPHALGAAVEELVIEPGKAGVVRTGIAVELPEGTEGVVRPRSGLARERAVTVLNSPGTVDQGYRGEIGVILINHGDRRFAVKCGMRIGQLVVQHRVQVEVVEVESLTETDRGGGGFGSTGL